MKKVYIVVGLGYGDEGKGLATDFLCSRAERPLVIRFNGGHQAGHTVVTNEGKRHVFSSFGSGTLQNVDTYWSKYCTFSPSMNLIEYAQIKSLGIKPSLFIDNACPITTHYDILFNRLLETTRNNNRYGSCGLGFGATINREVNLVGFTAKDMMSSNLVEEKIKIIRNYYEQKINKETNFKFSQFNHDHEDQNFKTYIQGVRSLINKGIFNLVDERSIFVDSRWETLIFEGAQGILLDMDYGVFPHVTFSNTTSKNAASLISKYYKNNIKKNVLYVTRAYQTRHGAGPFRENTINLINNDNETNVSNEFQGRLRLGYLDIDLLNYAIECDDNHSRDYKKSVLITCIDQLKGNCISYIRNNEVNTCNYKIITSLINCEFSNKYFSFGPNSIKIVEDNSHNL